MAQTSPLKKFSLQDVQDHTDRKSAWLVIHDKVYDVTNWLPEHPGGEEILLGVAGKDASKYFENFGHSTDARSIMNTYLVGKLRAEGKTGSNEKNAPKLAATSIDSKYSSSWELWLVLIALSITAWLLFQLF